MPSTASVHAPALASAISAPPPPSRDWALFLDLDGTLCGYRDIPADVALSPPQQAAWRKVLDPLDVSFFPYRGKSAAEATAALNERCGQAAAALTKIMTPAQRERLEKLRTRLEGTEALLREDLATKIQLTSEQRAEVARLIADA